MDVGFGLAGGGVRGIHLFELVGCQVIADGVGQDEVSVGQALHEGAGAQAIGAMIAEIGLADDVQPREVRHQVVVHPEATHGVVHGRVDAHRVLVRILARDAVVHVEQVAVALLDDVGAEALDGIAEVQVDGQAALAHAAAFIAGGFGVAGGHVARHEVAEAGVFALQEVIALSFGDLAGGALVALRDGYPNAAVVAQGFAHQGELALVFAGDGDAGRVNLGEAGIGEQGAALVCPPDGGGVAAFGIGGEVIDVAVAAGAEHHSVGEVALDFARDQVAGDDAAGAAIHHDEVEHLGARGHRHGAETDLALQRLVGAEEQLLARLAARVESARDLRAAETAVIEVAGVLAGKRYALPDALIDDVEADAGETINVGFAGAEIAALDGVVEQAVDAVAVIVIVLGGIDAALRRDAVRAPGGILEAEAVDVVAQLGQARRGAAAGQSRAHHDDGVLPLVGRIHQLEIEAMAVPSRLDRARGRIRIEFHAGVLSYLTYHLTRPVITAIGMEQLPMAIRMAKAAAPFFNIGV